MLKVRRDRIGALLSLAAAFALVTSASGTQQPTKPAIEKLSDGIYRLGAIRVDTRARELTVPGEVNDVMTLEFVANAKDGAKAYESLLTLNTDAISFNVALLLLDLDPKNSKPPKFQFDPDEPRGDPVAVFVSWGDRRVPIHEVLINHSTKKIVGSGPWVYTGSTFTETSDGRRFMAELDGVLIGLMHGPSALIEYPGRDTVGAFGAIQLNRKTGLTPGTAVIVSVQAVKRRSRDQ